MSEHRGLWIALGVALVTVGSGGSVSLLVGHSLSSDPNRLHLRHAYVICTVIWIAGAAVLGLALISILRRSLIKGRVSDFTLDGMVLLNRVCVCDANDKDAIDEIREDSLAWQREIVKYLKWRDPRARVHFVNDTGRAVLAALQGATPLSTIEAEIDTRLARLAEITGW